MCNQRFNLIFEVHIFSLVDAFRDIGLRQIHLHGSRGYAFLSFEEDNIHGCTNPHPPTDGLPLGTRVAKTPSSS